jgi:hypothetical protein
MSWPTAAHRQNYKYALKKINLFKQSVCYPKAMATSKIYSKSPALGENYRYFF